MQKIQLTLMKVTLDLKQEYVYEINHLISGEAQDIPYSKPPALIFSSAHALGPSMAKLVGG